jgi:hypothetical protein
LTQSVEAVVFLTTSGVGGSNVIVSRPGGERMQRTELAVAVVLLGLLGLGCGGPTTLTPTKGGSGSGGGGNGAEAGVMDANFSLSFDGDPPDLPRRPPTTTPDRFVPDRPVNGSDCPPNADGERCQDIQFCRQPTETGPMLTCTCTGGRWRCQQPPPPPRDAPGRDAPPDAGRDAARDVARG